MISVTRHLWIVFAAIIAAAIAADSRHRSNAPVQEKVVYIICSEIAAGQSRAPAGNRRMLLRCGHQAPEAALVAGKR